MLRLVMLLLGQAICITCTSLSTPAFHASAGPAALSILDFGGKPAPGFNNQGAIAKAMKACEASNGCTLLFPPQPGATSASTCPTPDCLGATTYLSSAINLTSHLRVVLPAGVQLRGTEDFKFNCGGSNTSTCDDLSSTSWPTLPWSAYPSPDNLGGTGRPVKQAFIRGYNLTNVTLTGGGTIHGGGGWWWCVRMNAITDAQGKSIHADSGPHAPKWCPEMVKAGKIPGLTLDAPHMLHIISSSNILLDNITITTSPSWTLHFQYCSDVTVRHTHVFNANNGSIEAPNADGIDVHSSRSVHVHDSVFDVGDDALCCKSGADYLGREVAIPTRDVMFENIEVRNGHGLTLGSEASGGMLNITYRSIFINGKGGPQAPGLRKRPGGVGGIHFKTGRGRGGHWENITWENIYGNFPIGLFGFAENHGSGYNQSLGPTNATGTPTIKNLLIKDVILTDVMGPATIFTLAEAPVRACMY